MATTETYAPFPNAEQGPDSIPPIANTIGEQTLEYVSPTIGHIGVDGATLGGANAFAKDNPADTTSGWYAPV